MNVIDALRAATKSHLPEHDDSAVKLRKALQSAQQARLAAEADERNAAEERYEEAIRAYDARVAELDELRKKAVATARRDYGAVFMDAKARGVTAPQRGRGVIMDLPKLALGETQVTCTGVQHVDACPCEVCQRRTRGSTVGDDDEALDDLSSRVAGLSSAAEGRAEAVCRKRGGDQRPRGTRADGQKKTPVGGQDDERRAPRRQRNGATGVEVGTVEMGEAPDAAAQLPRATPPAEAVEAAAAESTTITEAVAGSAPTVTDYTALADQLLAFLASEGLTTDHAHAVAALESSHGNGPGAIAFLQQNKSYLRPASRT